MGNTLVFTNFPKLGFKENDNIFVRFLCGVYQRVLGAFLVVFSGSLIASHAMQLRVSDDALVVEPSFGIKK